jgi:hypothetical protein
MPPNKQLYEMWREALDQGPEYRACIARSCAETPPLTEEQLAEEARLLKKYSTDVPAKKRERKA